MSASSAGGDGLDALVERLLEPLRADERVRAALDAAPATVRDALPGVLAGSDFVARVLARDGGFLEDAIASGALERTYAADDYVQEAAAGSGLGDDDFMAWLRRWRARSLARIAWRDLAGWASVEETLAELSAFADAAIDAACSHAHAVLIERFGVPRSSEGVEQPLVIVGMGKLGGAELNFSSDIDLVFLFPEHGETDGKRPVENEEFFTRLGQAVIRLLDAVTADGFVFRTDMRLRPFGDSGPLVASFASFEDYLLRHGRAWERYAWVKARALTGCESYAELYANAVRPFVYRRYLDFGVFESLREMKGLIAREVQRRDLVDNVKLGPGGIREVEFVVQAMQLVRGGQDRRLQTPSLLTALPLLEGGRLLPDGAAEQLRESYLFLRRLENHLQMLDDAQCHALPTDPLARARIARSMGLPDWSALHALLDERRAQVSAHFRAVVFAPEEPGAVGISGMDLGPLWEASADTARITASLEHAGFDSGEDAVEAVSLLARFRDTSSVRHLDTPARRRLRTLTPELLADIARTDTPVVVLARVLRILEAIGARSVYFALLHESRSARQRLVELCGYGDFLAAQIAAHPLLLDELVDDRIMTEPPTRAALAEEMAFRLEQVADDDPEQQVQVLREFQRAAIFRIAVADLTGRLPIMRVSDRLTDVAELIVQAAMRLAWHQITAQYGVPMCGAGDARRAVSICAVGYGKLGGMELGYASDLDLVFLHDSCGDEQETMAAQPVDNQVFFVRLAQRIVHLLTMHSRAGRLYEVDMRLRPSGKGGMLVTSIEAFDAYQRGEAWTWEHQALLHARAVAGEPSLRTAFEDARLNILREAVRLETLRDEVRTMRERMRKELSRATAGQMDLKQDRGGIADIEFLAQYWALNWAREWPAVALYSDTIRQLESVASGNLVPQETVDVLTGAYRAYRRRLHRRSLENESPVVDSAEFAAERAAVSAIWQGVFAV